MCVRDDGIGEGKFPVYGGLRVIGSCVEFYLFLLLL